jgi:predicted DNA-binding transcriptional regulator AlpA
MDQQIERAPVIDPEAYTIPEFCRAHRVGRTTLYRLIAEGLAPEITQLGARRIITREAAARWRESVSGKALPGRGKQGTETP